eukprot:TRINITY_DN6834_c0_g1_i1.p1 TRINITY_DN6834_c0_g1~~TRINITY_DN6834_c0_g1_i1.p1  ORF type:complete len:363 (+),score=141.41 TRINITY_DN6834_c0_g1_i1:91-1179(+)
MADYSGLKKGTSLQADYDGSYYAATVVEVSTAKKRAKAPVKVHFTGFEDSYDCWLGADKLRSKAIKKAPAEAPAPKAKAKAKAGAKDKSPAKEPKKADAKDGKKKEGKKSDEGATWKKVPEKPEPKAFEIGYWGIRGLGAVLRMILEYKEAKYVDHIYSDKYVPEGKDQKGALWFGEDKPKILEKNPLANLPYVTYGNDCVCQTNAVLNYLGQKLRLNGRSRMESLKNDQLLCEVYDVRNNMIDLVYAFKNCTRTEDEYKKKAGELCDKGAFAKFEAWFEKYDTEYLSGPKPLTADFHLWEMLDQHNILAERMSKPSIFDKIPKCKAFYDRFRALPSLSKYFESEAYKMPINNKMMAGAFFS